MSRFWGLFCNELAKLRTRWVIRLGVLALVLTALAFGGPVALRPEPAGDRGSHCGIHPAAL